MKMRSFPVFCFVMLTVACQLSLCMNFYRDFDIKDADNRQPKLQDLFKLWKKSDEQQYFGSVVSDFLNGQQFQKFPFRLIKR